MSADANIVRCANSHDVLVAALEKAEPALRYALNWQNRGTKRYDLTSDALDAVCAAIAKAKGEA